MTDGATNVGEAVGCLSSLPGTNDYSVQPGMVQKYQRRIYAIIDEDLGLSPHDHRMSKSAMKSMVNDLLHAVAKEVDSNPGSDPQGVFHRLKDDFLSKDLGGDPSVYTFTFPLNLFWDDQYPSSFSVSNTDIENISRSEWEDCFLDPAIDAGETSLDRFLNRASPNELDRDIPRGHTFTFWKTECSARDQLYALSVVQNVVQLFLGELNFMLFRGTTGKPRISSRSGRPPNARWSRLQVPFFYLIFEKGGGYCQHWITDYDYRRKPPNIPSDSIDRIRSINEFPDLSVEHDSMSGVNRTLVSALFAFQSGITASTPEDSFFNFWRGLEWLSQAKGKELLKRAQAAYELDLVGDFRFTPEQEEAFEELLHKRNSWAHKGAGVRISEQHQSVAKVLLECLIEVYLHLWEEERDNEHFSELLKYLSYSEEEREHIDRILSEVRELM